MGTAHRTIHICRHKYTVGAHITATNRTRISNEHYNILVRLRTTGQFIFHSNRKWILIIINERFIFSMLSL